MRKKIFIDILSLFCSIRQISKLGGDHWTRVLVCEQTLQCRLAPILLSATLLSASFFLDSSGSGQAILAGAFPQGTIKLQKQYMDMLFWFLANHANIQHTVTDIAHSPPSTPGLDFHEQKRRDLGSRITLNYCALADRVQFYTLN